MSALNKPADIFLKTLKDGLNRAGVKISESSMEKMTRHYLLLSKWNRKINLTGIIDPMQAAIKHFLDSLALLSLFKTEKNLLDMGAGGGFPGVVLACCKPELEILLVESIGKKAHFLREVKRALQLENITIYNGRVEDMPGDETFDLVTGRAVAEPVEFEKLAGNKLRAGGKMAMFLITPPLAIKGYSLLEDHPYTLPILNEKRRIALYEKSTNPRLP